MSSQYGYEAATWPGIGGYGGRSARSSPFEGEEEAGGLAVTTKRVRLQMRYPLLRAIPDDPDWRKHVPIEYRMNAKTIVDSTTGELQKGKNAEFLVDLVEWGIRAAEIFAEGSKLVGGLGIATLPLTFAMPWLAIGRPYKEAAEIQAARWARTGFSRGVVMGADKRPLSLVSDYWAGLYFAPGDFRNVQVTNYKVGLFAGWLHGHVLSRHRNQWVIFHRDLGRRLGDQSFRGPRERWRREDWRNWYTDAAAVFSRDHLTAPS
jgi:hypothetical protein